MHNLPHHTQVKDISRCHGLILDQVQNPSDCQRIDVYINFDGGFVAKPRLLTLFGQNRTEQSIGIRKLVFTVLIGALRRQMAIQAVFSAVVNSALVLQFHCHHMSEHGQMFLLVNLQSFRLRINQAERTDGMAVG